MERIIVPPSAKSQDRQRHERRAVEIKNLKIKGSGRTPADNNRLLDLLSDQFLDTPAPNL